MAFLAVEEVSGFGGVVGMFRKYDAPSAFGCFLSLHIEQGREESE